LLDLRPYSKEKFVRDKPHVNIGSALPSPSCDYLDGAPFSLIANAVGGDGSGGGRSAASTQYPYQLTASRPHFASSVWRTRVAGLHRPPPAFRSRGLRNSDVVDQQVDGDGNVIVDVDRCPTVESAVDLDATYTDMSDRTVLSAIKLEDCVVTSWSTTVDDNTGTAVEHLTFGCQVATVNDPEELN
jgi:hypothetical protein